MVEVRNNDISSLLRLKTSKVPTRLGKSNLQSFLSCRQDNSDTCKQVSASIGRGSDTGNQPFVDTARNNTYKEKGENLPGRISQNSKSVPPKEGCFTLEVPSFKGEDDEFQQRRNLSLKLNLKETYRKLLSKYDHQVCFYMKDV